MHQEKRTSHIRCKEIVKILYRVIPDCCSLRDTCVGHEHIQLLADDGSNFICEQRRSLWSSQVCPYCVGAASFGVDTLDQRLGFLGGTTVMNQYMCTRLSKCQRCGSSNSTGGPRHKCSFVVLSHPYSLSSCPSQHLSLSRLRRRGDRRNSVAFIQKPICFKNKILVIFVPRSMVGVGIQDQLGVRHVLNEIKRIHCVNDYVVISAHDQRRLLDVLQIREALSRVRAPFADGGNLGSRNLVADRGIAVLSA